MTWYRPEVLEQFGVLSSQFENLNEELHPILNHFVLHPQTVNLQFPNQSRILLCSNRCSNAGYFAVPDLLRTKVLPEMEIEEQKLFDEYEQVAKDLPHNVRIGQLNVSPDRTSSLTRLGIYRGAQQDMRRCGGDVQGGEGQSYKGQTNGPSTA